MTQTAAAATTNTTITGTRTHGWWSRRPWLRMFLGGLMLWVATVAVTFVTQNANLVPTIILLGSFLVPVTFVAYAFAHAGQVVTAQRILTAFVYGGVLGVLGASLLEAEFLRSPSAGTYLYVGLIEEAVKLAALWLLARRLPRYTMRDGIVLGATVGFGFAALESAGYAFNALFTATGLSLPNLVETEVLRGILTPVGHGLWTAILGGVLFGARFAALACLADEWQLGIDQGLGDQDLTVVTRVLEQQAVPLGGPVQTDHGGAAGTRLEFGQTIRRTREHDERRATPGASARRTPSTRTRRSALDS